MAGWGVNVGQGVGVTYGVTVGLNWVALAVGEGVSEEAGAAGTAVFVGLDGSTSTRSGSGLTVKLISIVAAVAGGVADGTEVVGTAMLFGPEVPTAMGSGSDSAVGVQAANPPSMNTKMSLIPRRLFMG
jgi:hypothetical protein